MGNKPAKVEQPQVQQMEGYLVKVVPPVNQALAWWFARDMERIHRYTPENPRAIEPSQHCIEYMRLNGLLDLDLDDPDLAPLFK